MARLTDSINQMEIGHVPLETHVENELMKAATAELKNDTELPELNVSVMFTPEEKVNVFKNEIELLNYDTSKQIARVLVKNLPDYFFTVAASSSSKYHPSFALGEGGLVRHTKMAVHIAHELLGLEQYENEAKYHDEIIIALMMHDGWKHGLTDTAEGHTVFEHPIVASKQVIELLPKVVEGVFTGEADPAKVEAVIRAIIARVAKLIRSHMGQWNTSKYSNETLEKPRDPLQQFVHLCDYLASRKWVTLEGMPFC